MVKLFFAIPDEDKEGLVIKSTNAEEDIGGVSIKYVENGYTHVLFRKAVGKPRREFGLGFTPEEAAQSFRDGNLKAATELEKQAVELRRLSELEIL